MQAKTTGCADKLLYITHEVELAKRKQNRSSFPESYPKRSLHRKGAKIKENKGGKKKQHENFLQML